MVGPDVFIYYKKLLVFKFTQAHFPQALTRGSGETDSVTCQAVSSGYDRVPVLRSLRLVPFIDSELRIMGWMLWHPKP